MHVCLMYHVFQSLPKPQIKSEPLDDSPDIQEYDTQSSPLPEDEKENVKGNYFLELN